jgi:hypothetical protein
MLLLELLLLLEGIAKAAYSLCMKQVKTEAKKGLLTTSSR